MLAAAVIVAAGKGVRAQSGSMPKQYQPINGRPMLSLGVATFVQHPAIRFVLVVIDPNHRAAYDDATAGVEPKLLSPVAGGSERQASVLAGLEALVPQAPDCVLIHDAARPFVSAEIITRVLAELGRRPGAIAAIPVADTLKREGTGASIAETLSRSGLWRAQTPQGFRFRPILEAHRRARDAGRTDFTDDAAIAEWAGLDVGLIMGSESNRKMTTAEDFATLQQVQAIPDIRSGTGFDVHRFTSGDHVMLCGLRVPHDQGVEAHSDGDVALHALTDALLGAIGAGDIGQHFPPSKAQWRGAESAIFLAEAARLVGARGGGINNVDVTVLCERPRIGPYRDAMRARLAEILKIGLDRTSVKATTTERLGFTGRGEGLAAMATATIWLPPARA